MAHRMHVPAFLLRAPAAWRSVVVAVLVLPFTACATTPVVGRDAAPGQGADCFAVSTLPEKRACFAAQDQPTIDDCERMRLLACAPYRGMEAAEKTLRQAEADLVQSARQAYRGYFVDDPAYLDDLATRARDANASWRAYRDAQCALEPLAQGMARSESENLAEACRLGKTQARIAELESLKPSARS